MISSARIYIFNVIYRDSNWLSVMEVNQLAGLMSQTLSHGLKELTYKNLQFINVYDKIKYGVQIHINKISYKKQRILPKEAIADLRSKLRGQLKKIPFFKFQDVLIVNDEFDFKPTPGFLIGDTDE